MPAVTKRQKILFLVGTPYSGSTLIGSSIKAPGASFLSEVDRFALFGRHDSAHLIEQCTTCHSCGTEGDCPVFGETRAKAIGERQGLLARYLELIRPCGDLVIDASKSPDWVMALVDEGLAEHADVYAAMVSRHPVAYAFSAAEPLKQPYWVHAVSWRETYLHAFRVLLHRQIPFIPVRYESIFNDAAPERLARRLSLLLGAEVGFDLGSTDSIGHCLGGNLGTQMVNPRFKVESLDLLKEFDRIAESWKLSFYGRKRPVESRRWVDIGYSETLNLLSIPGVMDLAGQLGYTLHELGDYFPLRN